MATESSPNATSHLKRCYPLAFVTIESMISPAAKRIAPCNDHEPDAQAKCLQFCSSFYERLPAELRVMVYRYISTAQYVPVHEKGYRRGWAKYWCQRPATPADYWGYRRQWNVNYVGEDVLQELAENWYKTSVFNISGGRRWIEDFFSHDRWGLGLVPSKLITTIEVDVEVKMRTIQNLQSGEDYHDWENKVLKIFNEFRACRKGLMIKINIVENGALRPLHQIFEFIFPTMRTLREAGFRTQLTLHGTNGAIFDAAEFSPEGFVLAHTEHVVKPLREKLAQRELVRVTKQDEDEQAQQLFLDTFTTP
ncbi:hypothetical protein B0J11DRAFT_620439 [Dendryphion nanum]|uniref:Uncharacterized protein n=1 Tax=Dendryphion nanum TaxID=256645 RepID=A0A9P9CYF6_9PLEO|nr:hypothetical protein B0J11DRAFT_620439 [Dendryphion nanum]